MKVPKKVRVHFSAGGVNNDSQIYDLDDYNDMLTWCLNEKMTAFIQLSIEELAFTDMEDIEAEACFAKRDENSRKINKYVNELRNSVHR